MLNLYGHTHKKRIIFPCEILFLLSLMGILSFTRHYKLWGILSDPGDGGGEEGGWHGYPEERQNTFARRAEDGKAESQASHRRWLWVQERNANMSFPYFYFYFKSDVFYQKHVIYGKRQFSSPRSQLSAISTSFHWNLGVLNLNSWSQVKTSHFLPILHPR